MKKNYIILLLAILCSGITMAQEAQKNYINYQGVARNGADQLMANETMTIGIALKMGSASGAATYAENHSVVTDANGVFSLKIGNGDTVSGEYNTIPWGSEATFVTVLVNGSEIGTTEMMAVPYALSSGDASQSATEVPYDNAVSGLAATNAQEAIDELVGSGAVDADADPENELQTLVFDAGTNELSLTDGNSVVIPNGGPGGTDDQNAFEVPFDNSTSTLTATDTQAAIEELAAGGLVDTDDQDLSLSGTLLQISDGTGVDLAPIIPPGGTDDQNAGEVPFDNSTSTLTATDTQAAIEELAAGGLVDTDDQDLSLSGTMLQISDGTGVDLAPIIPSGGTDDQNAGEVPYDNTASGLVAANTQEAIDELTLGLGGGSSLWSANGSDIFYEDGNVGVGTSDIRASLHVKKNPAAVQPLLMLEEESDDFARIAIRNEGVPALWNILGRAYDPIASTEISTINFRYINGLGGQEDVMTLAGNRRVGINTVAPTASLDVVGNIRSSSLGAGGNVVADTDGNLIIGAGGGGTPLWTEDTDGINYSSGNVGIGQSSSSLVPLSINSDYSVPINLTSSVNDNYLQFSNATGYKGYMGIYTGDDDMDFGTGAGNFSGKVHLTTNASPKLTVVANGNIGIGNTTPDEDFVIGTNLGSGWVIPAASVGGTIGGAIQVGNPTEKFSASASSTFNRTQLAASNSNGYGQGIIEMQTRQLNIGRLPGVNTTQTYPLRVVQNVVGEGGKYGFNLVNGDDATANWELFVTDVGQLALFQNNDLRGSFDPTSGNYSAISDARLKTGIQNVSEALPKLLKLKPKKYSYKSNKGHTFNGFLAQDLQAIFPEMVSEMPSKNDGANILVVDYNQLISLTISGLQEQQQQIDAQAQEMATLEERLQRLEARLNN